ncbi:MAG: ribonuclease P [Candidatus Thorarchaeota archaeon]|nr:ribonuclease P [Candidatus Thorarchaeota archaeon]
MPRRRSPRTQVRDLAKTRISLLWEQASKSARTNPELARRQMEIADKVAQKARVKIPLRIKRQICKKCGRVLIPGGNCRIRVRNNRERHVVVTCLECGAVRRFPVR